MNSVQSTGGGHGGGLKGKDDYDVSFLNTFNPKLG